MMSLVKKTILQELDFSIDFKRWLKSKRENHYQIATKDYSSRIRRLIRTNLKRKQREKIESRQPNRETAKLTQSGLVVIRLGDEKIDGHDGKPIQKLAGICVERSIFSGAQENDKVLLIPLKEDNQDEEDTSKRTVSGIIVAVDKKKIRIRFMAPLVLDTIEQVKKDDDQSKKRLEKPSETPDSEDYEEDAEKGDENKSKSSGSIVEDEERKSPEIKFEDENGIENSKVPDSCKKTEETVKQDGDNDKTSPKIKPVNYGIKIEPADDKDLVGYINCLENALIKFEKQSCSLPLHRCLLGYYSNYADSLAQRSRMIFICDLPKPKYQQELAIEQSIKRRISLVEGPAGSGKTLIAAHIACNVARVRDYKVLVCSPIQFTVDKLTELIHRVAGVEVIKLSSRRKPRTDQLAQSTSSRHPHLTNLQSRLRGNLMNNAAESLGDWRCLDRLVDDEIFSLNYAKSISKGKSDLMYEQAQKQVSRCSSWKRSKIEQRLLQRANIVCCTTSQAGSSLLEGLSFNMMILDDAQLVSEIDCLVPFMTKGLKQITLLSDMRRQIRLARIHRNLRQSSMSIATAQATKSPIPLAPTLQKDVTTIRDPNHASRDDSSIAQDDSIGQANKPKVNINGGTFTPPIERRRTSAKWRARNDRDIRQSDTALLVGSDSQSDLTNPASPNPSLYVDASNELGGLFERFLSLGLPAVDLRHQFRMHETLASFTNFHFYLNRSKNDSTTNHKLADDILSNLLINENNFCWLPKKECLTAIFRSKPINEKLYELIETLVSDENIEGSRIGVIFNRQQDGHTDEWQAKLNKRDKIVQCGTIENFLGQEKDFIVLVACSCDESQASQKADLAPCSQIERNFMINDCTLNIALTRARLGLFVLTDYGGIEVAQQSDGPSTSAAADRAPPLTKGHNELYCLSWRKMMDYYEKNELIS